MPLNCAELAIEVIVSVSAVTSASIFASVGVRVLGLDHLLLDLLQDADDLLGGVTGDADHGRGRGQRVAQLL